MEKLFKQFNYKDLEFFSEAIIKDLIGNDEELLITEWREKKYQKITNDFDNVELVELYEDIFQKFDALIKEEKDDTYKYILVSYAGVKVLLIDEEFDEKCYVIVCKKDLKNIL